jgi:hypothetical protein
MTEAEAKTKWCPLARVGWYSTHGVVAINRHPMDTYEDGRQGVKEETRCIGSDCMMWRIEGVGGSCGLTAIRP